MAGSRLSFASLVTALLTLALLSQHGHASLETRAEEADASFLAPDTPEVMAITHKANAKSGLRVAPDAAMAQIKATYEQNLQANMQGSCNSGNIAVRKEWSDLDTETRLSFIRACHCMGNLPAKTPRSYAPGVRRRWDDWVAPHIKNWRDIHFSIWNTIWHREFVWIMEQALRQECGYIGYMPYFDWSRYVNGRLEDFPIFDGSLTSFSGDGDHRSETCSFVTTGPMSNWTVNLGPVPGTTVCIQNPSEDGLAYNPRPLERKFDQSRLANITFEKVAATILNVDDMNEFVLRIEARGVGLHSMPHMFMGGLQGNIPASPGDWWFFLHHCMLDRIWSFWQLQDPANRLYQVPNNQDEFTPMRTGWGPVPPLTINTKVKISDIFRQVTVRDVMSTTAAQYCYKYE